MNLFVVGLIGLVFVSGFGWGHWTARREAERRERQASLLRYIDVPEEHLPPPDPPGT